VLTNSSNFARDITPVAIERASLKKHAEDAFVVAAKRNALCRGKGF